MLEWGKQKQYQYMSGAFLLLNRLQMALGTAIWFFIKDTDIFGFIPKKLFLQWLQSSFPFGFLSSFIFCWKWKRKVISGFC